MWERGDNLLVPGPEYLVNALNLPSQAPEVSGESLLTCVVLRCPRGRHLFFWQILANRNLQTIQLLIVEI